MLFPTPSHTIHQQKPSSGVKKNTQKKPKKIIQKSKDPVSLLFFMKDMRVLLSEKGKIDKSIITSVM